MSEDIKIKTYEDYKKVTGFASTGSTLLDLTVGGGIGLGFPYGKMVNYIGDSSSGKTFLAWELLTANFYKYGKKLKFNYDDSEDGNTFDTSSLYGVDLLKHDQNSGYTSNTVEEFDGHTSMFLKDIKSAGQKGIYIVDSLDGLSDDDKEKQEAAIEKAVATGKTKEGSGSYNLGTPSHLSKQYFKTKTHKLSKKKVLLLIISQIRHKLDAATFGKKYSRSGGKAMDFYAHTCLWLYNVKKIKKNGAVVGFVVRCVADKSKTPRPYRECNISLYFDYGIDDIGSCLDYLYELRGKDGDLTKAQHSIPWDAETGIEKTWKNTITWLKEIGEYDNIKQIKKDDTGKANLSKTWVEEYMETAEELQKKASEYFANTTTREELIAECEEHPKMYEELKRRVVEKWETIEHTRLSGRKRKYS